MASLLCSKLANFRRDMFEADDVSSLAFTRIVLGVLLLLDTVHERGLSSADVVWSESDLCPFPVSPHLPRPSLAAMCALYLLMVLGLAGIITGLHYRLAAWTYALAYWYMLLLERSRWNNHSYLFGLLALMLATNHSHRKWSLDVCWRGMATSHQVPRYQYFVLRFQIFLVYFYAGLKKTNPDWLRGYSMVNLSGHWIFQTITPWIPQVWIDYWLIHLGGFLFDSSVGFMLLHPRAKWLGFLLCAIFNLTNSQLFQIGMFPWVMLAVMPVYCSPDWPQALYATLTGRSRAGQPEKSASLAMAGKWRTRLQFCLLLLYLALQVTLPFAFVWLRGLNTWTTGMYGYNWDMMVHNWNHLHTRVRVEAVDSGTNRTLTAHLRPESWTSSGRWSHHADMVKQFALCVEGHLRRKYRLRDIRIYADVWTSLNGRFAQRMYDPGRDLVTAPWWPTVTPDWVMPLMADADWWRSRFDTHFGQFDSLIRAKASTWAVYVADFPGLTLRNYIEDWFEEPVRLLVFDGRVLVSSDAGPVRLGPNQQTRLPPGSMVEVRVESDSPAHYALLYPGWKGTPGGAHSPGPRRASVWRRSGTFLLAGLRYLIHCVTPLVL